MSTDFGSIVDPGYRLAAVRDSIGSKLTRLPVVDSDGRPIEPPQHTHPPATPPAKRWQGSADGGVRGTPVGADTIDNAERRGDWDTARRLKIATVLPGTKAHAAAQR